MWRQSAEQIAPMGELLHFRDVLLRGRDLAYTTAMGGMRFIDFKRLAATRAVQSQPYRCHSAFAYGCTDARYTTAADFRLRRPCEMCPIIRVRLVAAFKPIRPHGNPSCSIA
jgi:hypothetical protein